MKRCIIALLITVCFASSAYAADCAIALKEIFGNEGGYQCLKADSGNWTGGKVGKGILKGTKFGICAASYPKTDIRNLTLSQAAYLYERDFWRPLRLDGLKSQGLATTILDTAVNCGTGTAGVLMDKTANIIKGLGADAPATPSVGAADVDWINGYTVKRHQRVIYYYIFQSLRTERYVAIANRDRNKRQFLNTWLLRTWS